MHAITFSFSNKSDKTRLFPNNFCFRKHSSNKYISFCQYFIPQGIGTKFILYLVFERPYHATCQLIDFMSPKNILVPIITGMEYNIHILFPFDFITNLQYLYKLGVSIKTKIFANGKNIEHSTLNMPNITIRQWKYLKQMVESVFAIYSIHTIVIKLTSLVIYTFAYNYYLFVIYCIYATYICLRQIKITTTNILARSKRRCVFYKVCVLEDNRIHFIGYLLSFKGNKTLSSRSFL